MWRALLLFVLTVTAAIARDDDAIEGPIHQEDSDLNLVTHSTCSSVLHYVPVEVDGCTGKYATVSCMGVCPSFETPVFVKNKV